MSIEVTRSHCVGCGRCVAICPGNLLRLDEAGKAEIRFPRDCWGCAACLKECPTQAIALFLGADMGGLGGRLTARRENTLLHWTVRLPDGSEKTITTDSRRANRY